MFTHRMPGWLWDCLCRFARRQERPVESVVIPCTGEKYVAEGTLAAQFAARNLPGAREIVLVTDQPSEAFEGLPERAVVKTLPLREPGVRDFARIWQSRIIKIQAPLQARYETVLLMDSDMNLLRDFRVRTAPGVLLGSFRDGKMIAKLKNYSGPLPEMHGARRPLFKTHLNSAFLVAGRETWATLIPVWLDLYETIWNRIPNGQPPTDQLPLSIALDQVRIRTVDMGDMVNWPVSKKIGGRPGRIPPEVISAHGGFPLDEWKKYLADPLAEMNFHGQDYTRKERYTDSRE